MTETQADIDVSRWRIVGSEASAMALVELVPGVAVPRVIAARGPVLVSEPYIASGDAPTPFDPQLGEVELEVRMVYDAHADRFELKRLSVEASTIAEVTGTSLREVAPLRIMRHVIPLAFVVDDAASPYVRAFIGPTYSKAALPAATLEDAAMVHRLAEVVRAAPVKAVAETLGLQTRTATNWLVRARENGLLRPTLAEIARADDEVLRELADDHDARRWPR